MIAPLLASWLLVSPGRAEPPSLSITLAQAETSALAHSPVLKQAASDLAAAQAQVEAQFAQLVPRATADGAYRVNDRALVNRSPETLRAALEKVAGNARGQPITIRADARATHQSVVTAMDIAGRVGFAQVNIATVNQQPGG